MKEHPVDSLIVRFGDLEKQITPGHMDVEKVSTILSLGKDLLKDINDTMLRMNQENTSKLAHYERSALAVLNTLTKLESRVQQQATPKGPSAGL